MVRIIIMGWSKLCMTKTLASVKGGAFWDEEFPQQIKKKKSCKLYFLFVPNGIISNLRAQN